MKRITNLILLFFLLLVNAYAIDNAGIYLESKSKLSKEFLKKLAKGAAIVQNKTQDENFYTITWPDVSIKISTKLVWDDRDVQIKGMRNWVASFKPQTQEIKDLLNQIPKVTSLLGCVITPNYDRDQKVSSLIEGISKAHKGFIFSHQSFYNSDGEKIVGNPSDPSEL